ncbi:hypothetical protein [Bowmanella denitrificans]|uniref:hypothetical protein n=1 Tax=Bowmanella denitrificans TaxID=366582 RepID=UPI0011AEC692|nr:hypothetical protein [Bowmanella denitrificans]
MTATAGMQHLPLAEVKFLLRCAHAAFNHGLNNRDASQVAKVFWFIWETYERATLPGINTARLALLDSAKELVLRQDETGQFHGHAIVELTMLAAGVTPPYCDYG